MVHKPEEQGHQHAHPPVPHPPLPPLPRPADRFNQAQQENQFRMPPPPRPRVDAFHPNFDEEIQPEDDIVDYGVDRPQPEHAGAMPAEPEPVRFNFGASSGQASQSSRQPNPFANFQRPEPRGGSGNDLMDVD